jgi:hypothetical protein
MVRNHFAKVAEEGDLKLYIYIMNKTGITTLGSILPMAFMTGYDAGYWRMVAYRPRFHLLHS